ncbi:MAG: ABC transporter permease [Chloroflexi bacterium]|nr:ABC transporter permease [Chloroflexota bacterium]
MKVADLSLTEKMTTSLSDSLLVSRVTQRRLQLFFQNRAAVISGIVLLILCLIAALGPVIQASVLKTTPNAVDLRYIRSGPMPGHPLGTDALGRDVAARLLSGATVSLSIGIFCALISGWVGLLVGLAGAYYGGWIDDILMRFTDTMMSIPSFFVVLTVAALSAPSLPQIILLIGLLQWMYPARLVRSEVLSLRRREYVTAATCFGASDLRIMIRHVLPGVMPTLIVSTTLAVASAILTESSLSFLGVGIRPPQASWGSMLSDAQMHIYSTPVLAVYPGVLIALTVLAINFLGDGLREATDPRFQ